MAQSIVAGRASGRVIVAEEGLSFWGGVDPATGRVIDAHHPLCGQPLAGAILLMPTSRGSCSGSGVLLDLALNDQAPAAFVFREAEDVLTLGALIAAQMFGKTVPVLRLMPEEYAKIARCDHATISEAGVKADGFLLPLETAGAGALRLSEPDRAMLAGDQGEVVRLAMQIICAMATQQGATALTDITRVHIDGCIYASPANLRFAEIMAEMGATVCVPTTMNAISVDHLHWRRQGVAPEFGLPATRLADAYVRMGARPSFTCAPYLLENPPAQGEAIAWAESNAVIFANSVLAARTVKHPDFLDLCIALTGRAPLSGAYLDDNRAPRRVIRVERPALHDDSLWPMLGYLAGQVSPDRIPLLRGLEDTAPSPDDLKALCAAFGTTSAAPMLHVAGITPEADRLPAVDHDDAVITRTDLALLWRKLNAGSTDVDLVALGSPHFSHEECRRLAALLDGKRRHPGTALIVTVGPDTLDAVRRDGTLARLERFGAQMISDLCWCSISEPVFPPSARVVMTNSGKYAHYGPGLSGRDMRFGSLADCARAAQTGKATGALPDWLA